MFSPMQFTVNSYEAEVKIKTINHLEIKHIKDMIHFVSDLPTGIKM